MCRVIPVALSPDRAAVLMVEHDLKVTTDLVRAEAPLPLVLLSGVGLNMSPVRVCESLL